MCKCRFFHPSWELISAYSYSSRVGSEGEYGDTENFRPFISTDTVTPSDFAIAAMRFNSARVMIAFLVMFLYRPSSETNSSLPFSLLQPIEEFVGVALASAIS